MQEWKKEYDFWTTTTSMFHGADQNTVEFRFPELKANMRFWWRAVNQFKDPQEMHRQERALFGGTDIKSPVRFVPLQGKFEQAGAEAVELRFRFIMKAICQDESQWEKYKAILELSSYLGGLGQNSKIGYGSFCLNSEERKFPENEEKMLELIKETLQIVSNRNYDIKNNYLRPIWKGQKEGQEYKKYIVLRSAAVYKPLSKADFLRKAKFAEFNGKKVFDLMKKEIEPYSPLIIISAYPAKAGSDCVYPILTQFNYLYQKGMSGRMDEYYKSYFKAYHKQFCEKKPDRYRQQECKK